ncbi:MAG: sigma-70 family RNA polymerase sigma factor [Planctomycetota bacterium]
MNETDLEAEFERYRAEGDAAAFGAVFDLAAPELLSLAVRLAPTVGDAEDLVQTTFLALLERPRGYRRGARLMPYLVGILARQASKARRRAARTPDVARLSPRESEAPDVLLLAAERDAALTESLSRVPDLYREVLRQHLLDGRRPVEIAVRLGRTPGTVATQLLRGLDHLRRSLPHGLVAGATVLAGTRGEAALRRVVVERASELAATASATGFALSSIGGLFMSVKSVSALVIVCATLGAWAVWRQPARPAREALPAEAPVTRSLAPPSRGSADDDAAAVAPTRAEARVEGATLGGVQGPLTLDLTPATLDVTLTARLVGVYPARRREFQLAVDGPGGEGRVTAMFDDEGRARAAVGALLAAPQWAPSGWSARELNVHALHPRYLDEVEVVRVDVAAAAKGAPITLGCVLAPRGASSIAGCVRVPRGIDPRSVCIELTDERGMPIAGSAFGGGPNCDPEGRYRVQTTAQGLHRMRVTSPATLPCELWVELEATQLLELPDVLLELGTAEISGVVHLPDGGREQPLEQLLVHALRRGGSDGAAPPRTVVTRANVGSFAVLRGGPPPAHQTAPIAADGRFVLAGLDVAEWELEVHGVAAAALLPLRAPRIVQSPASEVVLWDDRCLLTVEVVDPQGPVAEAQVAWSFARGEEGELGVQQTVTDGAGRVRVVGDLTSDYALSVRSIGGATVTAQWTAAGRGALATRRIELPDSRASAWVLCVTRDSAPLSNVRLRLTPEGAGGAARELRATLSEGAYRFGSIAPGVYRARLGPTDDRGPASYFGEYVQTVERRVALTSGATLEEPITFEVGGRVRIELGAESELDPRAAPWLPMELLGPGGERRGFTGVAKLEAGEGFGTFAAVEGALRLGASNALEEALPAGRYELRGLSGAWSLAPMTFEVRAGEVTALVAKAMGR